LISTDQYSIICSGYESGDLAKGLQEATAPNVFKSTWGLVSAKMLYIVGMICFLSAWIIFFIAYILPSFERIVNENGSKLPGTSLEFLALGRHSMFIIPALILVLLFFLSLFFYSLLKYYGILSFDLPGLGRLMRRKHSAEILDNLALIVENHRPIDAGLKTLTQYYPNRSIRRKLRQSLLEVQSGGSWLESLFHLELIGEYDFAVLQAAERVGNLPWAMRETAFSNRRRLATRMNVFVQLLFPPVVICFGGVIVFVVMAAFMPLANLITKI
jgi:type II secretory pathway component PulF